MISKAEDKWAECLSMMLTQEALSNRTQTVLKIQKEYRNRDLEQNLEHLQSYYYRTSLGDYVWQGESVFFAMRALAIGRFNF